jgi:Phosphate-selective porin O and P
MKRSLLVVSCVLGLAVLLLPGISYAGPKWALGDESWMRLGFVGQVHFAHDDKAAEKNDFYLRRGRFMLMGQIMDGVKFFVETDNANAGKHGVSSSMKIQDAFVDVRLAKTAQWVKAGLILLPFSMENFSSAASLLGIDYNSEVIKLTNTFVWRDYGVSFHGDFGKRLAYRVGVFDGYDDGAPNNTKNPDAQLRVTGHVSYSLIGDVQTGWFYTQDKLGKGGSHLEIGAGYDHQGKATLKNGKEIDSDAWVVDFQSDIVLGDTRLGPVDLVTNGAYYDWDNASFNGGAAFVESGLRVSRTMLTLKYSLQSPHGSSDVNDFTVGLHYFLKGHHARAGVEYRTGDSDDLILAGLQFLL